MGGTIALLTTFLNTCLFPFGWRLVRSAALLEYPREYVALLDDDPALGHSHIRCTCGSDKVFNYGLPRNNGRYFLCRTCERSFKAAVYRQQWDTMYAAQEASNPPDTSWLESYEHLLGSSGDLPIMDLGCGCGEDTAYLRQQGFATLSCDYSETALRRLSGLVRSANSACFDMLDGLPFPSDAFNVVVANLSLHYFPWLLAADGRAVSPRQLEETHQKFLGMLTEAYANLDVKPQPNAAAVFKALKERGVAVALNTGYGIESTSRTPTATVTTRTLRSWWACVPATASTSWATS